MHFTRPRELLVAGLIGLVPAYVAFKFFYGSLPTLPRFAGATLLVLAVIEAVLAFAIRGRIRTGRLLGAIAVARAVALAKASSLLGALMLGGWLGVLAALVPRAALVTAAAGDVRAAIIGGASAAALIAGALWLEHCCRTPDNSDRDPDQHRTG
ncbi:DUF3180 domain-containing protein [Amycolatopsis cynarae]|uniref:DUF3180 domain-containing protein n=1 Tax=Amycolatopsis cynarae TaxID=2995223 RepID=A0ABY7B1P3_9PSEU|nr:DUF3180 domain-containing protein [Amycolatopsis sp. HUAS 11-8]WAL66111.1 DUF3180 domain-containing protein [Amycolatopsis sp. HUAS 11-8]